METVKGYVLLNKFGSVISRPFGSEKAALEASRYERYWSEFFAVAEIPLNCETAEPEKPEVNYLRITE